MRRYDNTSHQAVPTPGQTSVRLTWHGVSCVPRVSVLQLHGQCTRHNVNTQTKIVSLITLIKVTSLINSWLIELHTQREL